MLQIVFPNKKFADKYEKKKVYHTIFKVQSLVSVKQLKCEVLIIKQIPHLKVYQLKLLMLKIFSAFGCQVNQTRPQRSSLQVRHKYKRRHLHPKERERERRRRTKQICIHMN